ncbi:DUF4136 domain-containing protein [Alteromonas ponticola]|uniref:DUF4136 domain-containing protein n=1 Tax=Alteromonas aquimaris TaxID=2998417 RepID=A0ABT3P4P6_9ALTE|nr:DUF4136 domain-containing protein [Alteromonas aquimaris]MCW8107739.1 DUF4136 domain-containing protein [Alteromonas aquimaris]
MPKTNLFSRDIGALLLVVLVSDLMVGCASNKPQINMVEEETFATIETFYVEPPLNWGNVPVENHIMSTITAVMQNKGLTPVRKESADIEISFFPSTALKESGNSMSIGLGTGVFGRSSGISLGSIFSVPVGDQVTQYQNLQIDIIKGGEFIYSAVGSAKLESQDSITIQKELSELVHGLLKSYPEEPSIP